jgi:hypothetical protein
MNVILVAPRVPYMLTFCCLTFLYSSVKLCRRRFLSTGSSTGNQNVVATNTASLTPVTIARGYR